MSLSQSRYSIEVKIRYTKWNRGPTETPNHEEQDAEPDRVRVFFGVHVNGVVDAIRRLEIADMKIHMLKDGLSTSNASFHE